MSTSTRGFASMTPERRVEIARMGGKASQIEGRGYKWDAVAASFASRKVKACNRGRKPRMVVQTGVLPQ